MSFLTTVTSKYQITLPKDVRQKHGIKKGAKVVIYPTREGFIGRIKRRSKIFDFFGDLAHLDNGSSLKEIREEAQLMAAKEKVKRLNELSQAKKD